jgi:hypothetical protein
VEALYDFFNNILGAPSQRQCMINLDLLDLQQINLAVLANHFTLDEVLRVISVLPPDKAPRPDGFTTQFLQVVWDAIKLEIMQAFDTFWHMDT